MVEKFELKMEDKSETYRERGEEEGEVKKIRKDDGIICRG